MSILSKTLRRFTTPEPVVQPTRFEAALDWLVLHLETFSVASQSRELEGQDVELAWRIKPLGELILLVRVLERNGVDAAALPELRDAVLRYTAEFDWHLLGASNAAGASPLAMVLELFEAHGMKGSLERDYVAQLIAFDYFEGMDRIPYRMMDVLYSFDLAGFDMDAEDFKDQFAQTSFGKHQLLPRFSFDDMYSLTHAVFYLTDFGQADISKYLDEAEIARLRTVLARLMVVLLRVDNRDILGELLLCWRFCNFRSDANERHIIDRSFARIEEMRCASGAIAPTEKAFADEISEPGQFRKLYHTTLVCGMLFGLWGDEQ